jgi:AraC family transcriptional regulator, regulatory protein of adaptative response / methylated-DNA-[protein]-cysteine methyltransferase
MNATVMLTDDQAWAAILARDPSADAELVYAVTTTGVFCRPTCPSRRPSRDNVRFFTDAESAASAGFRPCRRCRPTQQHNDAALIASVSSRLRNDRQVTLRELARLTGRSPFTLSRLFKRVLGVTPAQYQRQQRAASFRYELAHGSARVTDAVYDAGFSGPGRAYENTQLGMAPGAYRAGAPNARIGYATAACPLGRILIAATERGLCSVILGASDEYLVGQLREQFPAAQIVAEPALDAMLAQVLTQFTDHPATLDLPLDLRATGFQMRVWEALRRIPRGETRTYSQVAQSLGQPKAVRAVARACATNQVAVVIPCHRVIGSNGKLTGYRWGIERKDKLLALEKSAPAARKSAQS